MPEGFACLTLKDEEPFYQYLVRVTNGRRFNYDEKFLERFYECYYPIGVDIFPLDYVAVDEEAENERKAAAFDVFAISDSFDEESRDDEELKELINAYGLNKQELDDYKAICDNENKQIKDIMSEAGLKVYETDKYKASYIVSERTSMDEVALLRVIHSNNIPNSLGIIKTREYIDEDALESAIYNKEIPDDVMNQISDCMIKKEVISLKLTKAKGE